MTIPVAEPRGITQTLFQPKVENRIFIIYPSVITQLRDDISPEFQGRVDGTPRQSLGEFFLLNVNNKTLTIKMY